MHCRTLVIDGKPAGFVCSSRRHAKPCKQCGRPSTRLCDFPLQGRKAGKTCDAPMCDSCATRVGPDRDYCRPHAEATRGTREDDAIAAKAEAFASERMAQLELEGGRWA